MSKLPKIKWDENEGAEANARRHLPRLVAGYFDEVRAILGEHPKPARLHAIRLASKQIRYTLEIFRTCYGAGFQQRIKALKDVQTALGEVNDLVASRRLLSQAMPKSPARMNIRQHLKKQAEKKAEEFHKLWVEEFDAAGQKRWWKDYFAGKLEP
jgi:CHAD domain-containing protein